MCKTVSGSIAITKNEDDLSYYDLHLLKDAFNMTPKAQSIKIKKKKQIKLQKIYKELLSSKQYI